MISNQADGCGEEINRDSTVHNNRDLTLQRLVCRRIKLNERQQVTLRINPLKCSGIRWSRLKLFNAIQV